MSNELKAHIDNARNFDIMVIMKKLKKLITATNVIIVLLIALYLLDCYLPLPEGYAGYTAWDKESPAALNYVMGSCGGLLTNYLGMGGVLENGNAFYRHFTQMFLHGGLLHLVANCVGLYFIGHYAEKRFGWIMTAVFLLVTGFIESFITDPLYRAMFPNAAVDDSVSVGISGGIFGLVGCSLASLLFDVKSFKKIDKPTLIVSAIYGVLTTYVVSFGWTTLCHNVALILGLASGTAYTLLLRLIKKRKTEKTEEQPEQE